MRRGGCAAGAAFAFVGAGFDEAADLELAVLDVVGDGVGGDEGDVLVGGVDEVAVAAADVALGIRQPLEEGVGADVEAGRVEGFVAAGGAGELAELDVPVLGAVGGEAVTGGDLGAREVVQSGAEEGEFRCCQFLAEDAERRTFDGKGPGKVGSHRDLGTRERAAVIGDGRDGVRVVLRGQLDGRAPGTR
ncbi:hypothetical protein [Streptomyces sp. NPDC088358]|uniref:hypothetical protein n=1 Tax=Streptomyces sp. NPDC088358 TaxID=3365857 RepID=UPI0038017A6D